MDSEASSASSAGRQVCQARVASLSGPVLSWTLIEIPPPSASNICALLGVAFPAVRFAFSAVKRMGAIPESEWLSE